MAKLPYGAMRDLVFVEGRAGEVTHCVICDGLHCDSQGAYTSQIQLADLRNYVAVLPAVDDVLFSARRYRPHFPKKVIEKMTQKWLAFSKIAYVFLFF